VRGEVRCDKSLSVRGELQTAAGVRAAHGIHCVGAVDCGTHLEAGWGIKAGGDLRAGGAIRSGEGIEAEGEVHAGPGYGVFAGLVVQREEWETSARVTARARPEGLVSGCWAGAGVIAAG
jgi:hypothetical protein